jgi:hypothetical protein
MKMNVETNDIECYTMQTKYEIELIWSFLMTEYT